MLLDVMNANELISQYRDTTNLSADAALLFLINRRRDIVNILGYRTFREMTLNYRTYFRKNQKLKIMRDYKQFIMTKKKTHTSDLVIGRNIIKHVGVAGDDEKIIVEYLFNRIKKHLKRSSSLESLPFMKKRITIEYIEQVVMKGRV